MGRNVLAWFERAWKTPVVRITPAGLWEEGRGGRDNDADADAAGGGVRTLGSGRAHAQIRSIHPTSLCAHIWTPASARLKQIRLGKHCHQLHYSRCCVPVTWLNYLADNPTDASAASTAACFRGRGGQSAASANAIARCQDNAFTAFVCLFICVVFLASDLAFDSVCVSEMHITAPVIVIRYIIG